ncbi:legumain-like [Daphnia pulicaria]|uniref:legumain-like n=1 Tax=Daphnia pulicaria TaxID=35523 RepID=UPI001EEA1D09|nr:legumain-like [Daphnia pulicaria]XP_046650887.1 legumain-like [Daphnia pulicaria]
MRSSAYVTLLAFVLVSCSVLSVAALSKSNHKFLGRIVSRAEETVQNIESLFHKEKPKNATAEPKQWAVLVAGSNGYYNYRHQADVCHAYQVLRRHGIPEENIITLMYDDIANSTENPTKGIIINAPNGEDVYQGVKKDYVGKDVTPETFLKVISGDIRGLKGVGTGRVLQSGPADNIFINFVDHGAPGLLAFPSSELHARTLQDTLLDMYQRKQFAKLVLYIEACESGSMFEDLLSDNLNIFVTTAANAHEHSFACYFDSDRDTYLGDVYSVMWMEDSEKEDLTKETLFRQFSIVRKETNTSHVQEYGDLTIGKMKVGEFQGKGKAPMASNGRKRVSPLLDAVPSGDVPLEILRHKLRKMNSSPGSAEIQRKIRGIEKKRQHLKDSLRKIVLKATEDEAKTEFIITGRLKLTNFSCYEELVNAFSQRCFHLSKNEYAYRHLFVLVNMCQSSIPKEVVIRAMDEVCVPHKFTGII